MAQPFKPAISWCTSCGCEFVPPETEPDHLCGSCRERLYPKVKDGAVMSPPFEGDPNDCAFNKESTVNKAVASKVVGADITEQEFDTLWHWRGDAKLEDLNKGTNDRLLEAIDLLPGSVKWSAVAKKTGHFHLESQGVDMFYHLWLHYDGTKRVVLWIPYETLKRDAERAEELYGAKNKARLVDDDPAVLEKQRFAAWCHRGVTATWQEATTDKDGGFIIPNSFLKPYKAPWRQRLRDWWSDIWLVLLLATTIAPGVAVGLTQALKHITESL